MLYLSPAKAYIDPMRKKRLDRIVLKTARMSFSKLMDEAAEIALPVLEEKYLLGEELPPVKRQNGIAKNGKRRTN